MRLCGAQLAPSSWQQPQCHSHAALAPALQVNEDSEINMHLIDYEYAGVNPVAYDIANHWCEYAADYHTETPHVLDYAKFPDHEQQQIFVSSYVKAVKDMTQCDQGEEDWQKEEARKGESEFKAPSPGGVVW